MPLASKSSLVERRMYLTTLMKAIEEELAGGYRLDFFDRVEKRMEPFSYMRGWESPIEFIGFELNAVSMRFYMGIGE